MSVLFPNVPLAPGVPPVLRVAGDAVGRVTQAVAAVNLFFAEQPRWAILGQDGGVLLSPDSFLEEDYRRSWRVPDFPLEQGGFATYDKVRLPPISRVVVTKGGNAQDRQQFFLDLDELSAGLTKIMVQDPEGVVGPFTIDHYDFRRRREDGVTLVTFDIYLTAVTELPAPTFQDTAQPSGANAVSNGTVQPGPPAPTPEEAIRAGA